MAIWNIRGDPAVKSGLEIVARLPAKPRRAPPLLFVHGAWHGAWCWEEHFLGYFASRGFASYALNLRGHGASRGARDARFCRIRDFVADVEAAVEQIGGEPILIGHSLGGFIVQKYLETHTAELGVLLASVPPGGGLRMVGRIARAMPLALLHANLVCSLRPLFSDANKARRSLFTDRTPERIVEECRARLQDDVILGLPDYLFLDLVDPARINTGMLVFGAGEDRMIDRRDVEATARAYAVEPVMIPEIGHDLMLDQGWERAAEAVAAELDRRLDAGLDREVRISNVA